MVGLMVDFWRFRHSVASVLVLPVSWVSASLVSRRLFSVVRRGSGDVFSRIPLYAFACVSTVSLAPCVSNSIGISRFIWSGTSLFAPRFARRSLSSLPVVPL
jgi:hypothetical protein